MVRLCVIPDCRDPHKGHGYCRFHLDRVRKHGSPHATLKNKVRHGAPERWLYSQVVYDGEACLIWPFARKDNGYANMRHQSPLRLMCTAVHGEPPSETHQAAHSCGKGHDGCISPRHLRWATPVENAADKVLHGTNGPGKARASSLEVAR